MPRIFIAIRKGRAEDMRDILRRTPAIPESCQWCTFLRNHDELTLEMVTEQERQWMWKHYAPELRMRLNLGIRRRLAPLLDNDRRKIQLANSLLFTLPGSPVIYYGDEIGMGDNIWMHDRNGVRTPMQWEDGSSAGFSSAPEAALYSPIIRGVPYGVQQVNARAEEIDRGSLWSTIHKMIAARKLHPAFGRGSCKWLELQNDHIVPLQRKYGDETLIAMHNLRDVPETVQLPENMAGRFKDVLSGRTFDLSPGSTPLALAPYEYLWLQQEAG